MVLHQPADLTDCNILGQRCVVANLVDVDRWKFLGVFVQFTSCVIRDVDNLLAPKEGFIETVTPSSWFLVENETLDVEV